MSKVRFYKKNQKWLFLRASRRKSLTFRSVFVKILTGSSSLQLINYLNLHIPTFTNRNFKLVLYPFCINFQQLQTVLIMQLQEKGLSFSEHINEDSSFALNNRKQRKIKRKTLKRKVTKILHTFCLAIRKNDGKIENIYFQKIISTLESNPETISKLMKNSTERHIRKILKHYEQNNQRQQNDKKEEISNEAKPYLWQHINYYMYPGQLNWQGIPMLFQY